MSTDHTPLPAAASPVPVPSSASFGANRGRDWQEIFSAFRGLRLAVHSDLAEGNANMVDTRNLRTQEALGWLVYHRLVWLDGEEFKARQPLEARKLWMAEGAAKELASRLFSGIQLPIEPGPVAPPETPEVTAAAAAREVANFPTGASDAGEPAAATPHRMKPGQEELFP